MNKKNRRSDNFMVLSALGQNIGTEPMGLG